MFRRVFVLLAMCGTAIVPYVAQAQSVANYSDIWWNPNESGWGVTIADHDTNIFAVLYAYRADGRPIWFTIPGGAFSEGRRIFQGDVYKTTGPAYTSSVFDPTLVTGAKVGTAAFDFSPPGLPLGTALLTYTINGVNKTKQIQRQAFGNAQANWGTDRTDLWNNAAESGWGLALAQHGNNIFGVWYTYDTDGEPLWLVLPGGSFAGPNSFSGTLFSTTGPYFGNATFDPSAVIGTQFGTATLDFSGALASREASPKSGQDACPGSGMSFAETNGHDPILPRLVCRQPFGDPAPPPNPGNAALILGTYSGNLTYNITIFVPGASSTETIIVPIIFSIVLVDGQLTVLGQTPFTGGAPVGTGNTFSVPYMFSSDIVPANCTLTGAIVVGPTGSTGNGTVDCAGAGTLNGANVSETLTGPWTASNPP